MAPTARLPPKKDVALALLEQASMYIHLDPRADSVLVPVWFKKQPQLMLQVGLNMPVPIPDLHVDEQGLSCTLSFNRSPFYCVIPWPAVFALVGENGQAMVWAEDVPAEVAAQAQAQEEKPRAHLRPVADGESAPPPPALQRAAEPKTGKNKPAAKKGRAPAKAPSPVKPKAKTAPKAPAKKATATKGSAAKKPATAVTEAVKPVEAQPAAKIPPKAAVLAKQVEGEKPKRELPPYLRVVK